MQNSVGEGFCWALSDFVNFISLILSTLFLWFCQLHFSDSKNVFLSAVFASLSEATIVAAIGREMSSLWCCNTSCGRTELYFPFLIWANTKYGNYTKYQTKYKIQILFNNTQNKILSQCITKYRIQILKYKIQKIKTKTTEYKIKTNQPVTRSFGSINHIPPLTHWLILDHLAI